MVFGYNHDSRKGASVDRRLLSDTYPQIPVETRNIFLNVLVVLLFLLVNPIYALFFCAFLNLTKPGINFWIFSFMFVLSFSLLMFLKDYNQMSWNSDITHYIGSFSRVDNQSYLEIIYRFIEHPSGGEPFYWFYVKLSRTLLFSDEKLFAFFYYFTVFALIAYLGKIVDANKFVIIIVLMVFLGSQLTVVYQLWRFSLAFLILMIGIFSFDAREKKWLSRIVIYSSVLFHMSAALVVVFFEFFVFFTKRSRKYGIGKLYFKEMIPYVVFVVIGFILLAKYGSTLLPSEKLRIVIFDYSQYMESQGYGTLFNSVSILVYCSLWLRRKELTKVDVFIATQYFILTILMIQLAVPGIFMRYSYYTRLGGSILIGKLIVANFRRGLILLSIYFFYIIYTIYLVDFAALSERVSVQSHNPVFGLVAMALDYGNILKF